MNKIAVSLFVIVFAACNGEPSGYSAGSRLKPFVGQGDGLTVTFAWYDSKLEVPCGFFGDQGEEYCLPILRSDANTSYFTDSACTTPAVGLKKSGYGFDPNPPKYAYVTGKTDGANTCLPTPYNIYEVGGPIETAYSNASGCAASTDLTQDYFSLINAHQPTDFVHGTAGVEKFGKDSFPTIKGDDGSAQRFFGGAGTEQSSYQNAFPLSPITLADGSVCEAGLGSDLALHCLPNDVANTNTSNNPSFEAFASTSDCVARKDPLAGIFPGSCDPFVAPKYISTFDPTYCIDGTAGPVLDLNAVGADETTVFDGANCSVPVSSQPGDTAHHYVTGAVVDPTILPTFKTVHLEQGKQLRWDGIQLSTGGPSFPFSLYDLTNKMSCVLLPSGPGEMTCFPDGALSSANPTGVVYSDAACTAPLIARFASAKPCTAVSPQTVLALDAVPFAAGGSFEASYHAYTLGTQVAAPDAVYQKQSGTCSAITLPTQEGAVGFFALGSEVPLAKLKFAPAK